MTVNMSKQRHAAVTVVLQEPAETHRHATYSSSARQRGPTAATLISAAHRRLVSDWICKGILLWDLCAVDEGVPVPQCHHGDGT